MEELPWQRCRLELVNVVSKIWGVPWMPFWGGVDPL